MENQVGIVTLESQLEVNLARAVEEAVRLGERAMADQQPSAPRWEEGVRNNCRLFAMESRGKGTWYTVDDSEVDDCECFCSARLLNEAIPDWKVTLQLLDTYQHGYYQQGERIALFSTGKAWWLGGVNYDEAQWWMAQLPEGATQVLPAQQLLSPWPAYPCLRQGDAYYTRDTTGFKLPFSFGIPWSQEVPGLKRHKHKRVFISGGVARVLGPVTHPEHEALELPGGWYWAGKSRAVQSFSEVMPALKDSTEGLIRHSPAPGEVSRYCGGE